MTDPIRGTRHGTAPAALSVLDSAVTGTGQSAAEAMQGSIELARLADRRGFTRYWMNEHHAMPGVSTSSPPVLLARLTAETRRLRLGAGGIMLPNHPPLVVAEQFGMLEALAPGRIDLGLGRAPGTDPTTAAALRRGAPDAEDLPHQVAELLHFLGDDFPTEHPYADRVFAVPGPAQDRLNGLTLPTGRLPVWLLGSSGYSAQLAARLGLPFAFAAHFNPRDVVAALRLYREQFTPSQALSAPYALVSFTVPAAEDEREARRHAGTLAHAMLRMFQRKPYLVPSPDEVDAYLYDAQEQQAVDSWLDHVPHGTPEQVTAHLNQVQRESGADELMIGSVGHSLQARLCSTELIADAYGMPDSTR
ncbi:LLM class flavin-dependent oxidoreductase [Streptomyces sp. AD681]|uniref:LLM class flavin-dependent oxidoreductase n=1 Tax=Streptomyces sp. AD681 TaxID=3019069 RepID=UPI0022F1DD1C|nr:LLM class flavin-dependent oxidoreductase [Streptomyces sp. AD681]MDA5146555.1 LLM class flavin-dependent oxidoreductase [Streptomyces sp. AD681]